MEGVDFSVDRGRLPPGTISAGALSTLGGSYVPEGGHIAPLGRPGAGGVSGVPEIGRAGTPSGLSSLGQFQNRYYPSVSMHSPGTSYTMIGGFLNAGTHSSEPLKSVVPDIQQYWNTHTEGYPRYIINNNVYSPYLSYLPATESLSLFAHNSGPPTHNTGPSAQQQSSSQVIYHRIYDLHKDPYAAVGQNVATGLYGLPAPPVSSQTIRLSPEQVLPSGVCLGKQENTSRYSTDNSKRSSESNRRSSKNDFQHDKVVAECKSSSRDSEKKESSKRNESKYDGRSETKKESKSMCKTKGQLSASLKTKQTEKKGDRCKAEKRVSAQKMEKVQKTSVIKPMPSSNAENKSQENTVTKSRDSSHVVSSPCVVSSSSSPMVTTLATVTVTMSDSIVSLASSSAYLNGTESNPSANCKLPLNVAQTTETFSLPYYHSLFAHSQHGGQTASLENKGESLQTTGLEWKQCQSSVQTNECDRKIKTENGGSSLLNRDSRIAVSAYGHDCERQDRIHALKTEPTSATGKIESVSTTKCSARPCTVDLNQNRGSPIRSPDKKSDESKNDDNPTGDDRLKQSLTKECTNALTSSGTELLKPDIVSAEKIENVQIGDNKFTTREESDKNGRNKKISKDTNNMSEHTVDKCRVRTTVPVSDHRKNNVKLGSKKAVKCVVKSVPKIEPESEFRQEKIDQDIPQTRGEDKKDTNVSEKRQDLSAHAIESIQKSILIDRQFNARPGSAPPATLGMKPGDTPEKSPEKVTGESTHVTPIKEESIAAGAMNIPVGIAVARQRQGLTKTTSESRNNSDSAGSEDEGSDRSRDDQSQYTQEAKDREEFLRQQKSLLASSKVLTSGSGADIRNELPANLILTGSANGTGVPWQDDPTSRHFANQWLQSSHLNPASWLGQNPYAMNSAMPTSGSIEPGNLPYTVPAGFKLAQDPVTGQIFLLPATNLDMFDPTRLWSGIPTGSQVPPGHHSPFQSLMTTQQTTQVHPHVIQPQQTALQPQVLPQERSAGIDFALMMQQYQQLQQLNPPRLDSVGRGDEDQQTGTNSSGDSAQSTPSHTSMDCREKSPPTTETPVDQLHSEKEKILSVQPNTFLTDLLAPGHAYPYPYPYTPAQLSVMYNSGYLPLPGMSLPAAESNGIKCENSILQSRGTSPMTTVTTTVPEEDTKPVLVSPKHTSEQLEVPHPTDDNSNSKIDNSDSIDSKNNFINSDKDTKNISPVDNKENDCVLSESESAENIDVACDIPGNDENSLETKEPEETIVIPEKEEEITTSPKPVSEDKNGKVGIVNECANIDPEESPNSKSLSTKEECDVEVVNETGEKVFDSSAFPTNYNPYTDPQILQAADGLELLSALAEQRTKCPSVDKERTNGRPEKRKQPTTATEITKPVKVKRKRSSSERNQTAFHKKENKENKLADSFTTAAGDRIPLDLDSFLQLGTDTMDAIELDMRLRLAELQRRYKEKQRELARLHTKRDKDKDDDKHMTKRGPGRPRKRHLTSPSDGSASKSKSKEPTVKKKKLAEELVDRVFRKTGRALQVPLSKKANAITTLSMFKNAKANSNKADTSHGKKPPTKENLSPVEAGSISSEKSGSATKNKKNQNDNITQTVRYKKLIVSDKKGLWKGDRKGVAPADVTIKKKIKKISKNSHVKLSSYTGRSLETGLGLLAKFAANAAAALGSAQEKQKKKKRKKDDEDSDVDNSDTVVSSSNQKRKPGRPKKRNPSKSQGRTETIVAKKSKNFGLMRLQEIEKVVAKRANQSSDCKIKLDGQTPLKPLYLDEEWTLRRSERIFLSEPSPQPSPNFTPVLARSISTPAQVSATKSKSEKAKLQKAKNIQELSQKVKRKYSKNFNRKPTLSSTSSETAKQRAVKAKVKYSQVYTDSEPESDFSSEGDNVPLSLLKARPLTPEPRCCVIPKEELRDKLRVLLFIEPEGLFYEGEVKEIRPPDVYGVVIDNQRGNRPQIYSQEEILKLAVIDVKPGSGRHLPEGTRICAYWSQQFSCLYPGTISKASPNPHGDKNFVSVEFDDGDTGKIPLDHIRMLPQDFPLVSYDPSPLLLLGKRRRHTTSESTDCRKSISDTTLTSPSSKSKRGPGRPPKFDKERQSQDKNDKRESVDDYPDEVFRFDSVGPKYQRDGNNCKSTQVADWENQRRFQQEKRNGNKSYFKEYKYKGYSKLKQQGARVYCRQPDRTYCRDSDRMCDMKTNPLIRASAFDVKKLEMTSKTKIRHHAGSDVDSSDEYSDSSNDSGDLVNITSGNRHRFQDACEFSDESSQKDKRQGVSHVPKSEKKSVSSKRANGDSVNKNKSENSESTDNKAIISAFLPARQLWAWSGKSTKRPGLKGKAKKEFYKSIVRGNETITIGDCAVFLSTGRPNLPYVGRIESLWEGWGGQMVVRVKWFYHPEETKGGNRLSNIKGALFQSPHEDENDVQTISHRCQVLSCSEYKRFSAEAVRKGFGSLDDSDDVYYLAGTYEPTLELIKFEPGVL